VALTLTNANYLANNAIMAGIVEETVEEDPLLEHLPFETMSGFRQIEWNREDSLGAESQYIEPNDEIAESSPTWSNQTTTLSILADRIELDNFLVTTKDSIQSVEAAALASKGKQMMRKFHDTFYYGTAKGGSSSAFAGLHNLVSTSSPDMTVYQGSDATTGAAGTLGNLNTLIAKIKPGRADALIMNRNMLRRLSAPYIGNVQYNMNKDNFGDYLQSYSQIPILVSDYLVQTETISGSAFSAKTGGVTTTIFALKFGRNARSVPGAGRVFNNDGLLGIQAGGMEVAARHPLEKKDGFTRLLTWYHTVILGSNLSLARLDGINDGAFTV
jgi:hypothetical protein